MLARRLGAAARLSQSMGCTVKSSCGVASTSYKQHQHLSHTRGLVSSSLPGPFAATPIRLRKKKVAASEVLAEEELYEEEQEEEDLFDITAEDAPTKTDVKTKKAPSIEVSFQEAHEMLSEKLKGMDPEEEAGVDLSDWRVLVESARSADDFKKCLELAKQWTSLTYGVKSKVQKNTVQEATKIVNRACHFRHPEVMFDAVMNRGKNGLDYNLSIVRRIQEALVEKKIMKAKSDHALDAVEGGKKAQASESASSDQEGNVESNQDKLEKVDRTMALAASTCVFSSNHSEVDPITLIIAISGIIRTFELKKIREDDFYKVEVYPRLGRALAALCTTRPDIFLKGHPEKIRSTGLFERRCSEILQYVLSHRSYPINGSSIDVEAVYQQLVSAMQACGPALQEEFINGSKKAMAKSTM